jgi:hypothetical protein
MNYLLSLASQFEDELISNADEKVEAAVDAEQLLLAIVEKLNEYDVKPDMATGKEALSMIDHFRAQVAERVQNDYINGWKPSATISEESESDRQKNERIEDNRQKMTIKEISDLLRD